jgi:paraquat-inducible protein A
VHQAIALENAAVAHCSYCNAVLARRHGRDLSYVLAITIAAAIFFVIASATPVLAIEYGAMRTQANVWSAALSMASGWIVFAALPLAVATFLVPLLQISLLLWVLSFACAGRRAPAFRTALVTLHWLRPWSMSEVFLLGALVAIVKLSAWVHVVPGEGLWALGGLTILMAMLSRYESRAWWEFAEHPK